MSAIVDDVEKNEPIQVLFTLHEGFNIIDFTGPLQMLNATKHSPFSAGIKAFNWSTAAPNDKGVTSAEGLMVRPTMDFEEARDRIDEFDVLIVTGGNFDAILENKDEPIGIINAFVELQEADPSKERTLLTVCTGSLFAGKAGILQGLSGTTHPDYYTKMEIVCAHASQGDLGVRTDVMEERYVVNNARYELGEKWDENPFILDKRPEIGVGGRRKSIARKGSDAWKMSKRRESIIKRAQLPLGGLRVITSGGATAGMDATLYLIAALVSHESALEVARVTQFNWTKGVTVEGIDV